MWNDEMDGMLKERWGSELTSETAKAISEAMLATVSKNAVIGRAHRLGLPGIGPVTKKAKRKKNGPAKPSMPSNQRRMEAAMGLPAQKPWTFTQPKPVAVIEPLPVPQANDVAMVASVLDLESHHCRWPIDTEAGMGFCGCEKVQGSYCAGHAARAFNAPPDRSKRSSYVHPSTRAFGG